MQAHLQSSTAAQKLSAGRLSSSIAEGVGLAHDAGNLLGALGLYCDLLNLPGVLRPEHTHYARELRLLSQRSGALINRLLEGGNEAIEPIIERPVERLCAAAVVKTFTPLLRSVATPEVSLSMALAAGLPALPFEAEVLERILVNLTRNAATAVRSHLPLNTAGDQAGGQIHIGVCGDATRLKLTVMDNGPGMTVAVAAAFLKPSALPRGAMSGVGHRVVHELVHLTGGQLSISVVPKRGTTLQIEWPILGEPSRRRFSMESRTISGQVREPLPRSSEQSPHEGAELSC
jgi:nitrogen-specific signal transduction histidine kinase